MTAWSKSAKTSVVRVTSEQVFVAYFAPALARAHSRPS